MKLLALALLLAPAAHAADPDPFEVDGSCEALGNCPKTEENPLDREDRELGEAMRRMQESSGAKDGGQREGGQREQRTADGRVILPPDFVGPPAPNQCHSGTQGCTPAADQKTADWAGRLDGQARQDPNRLLGGPRPGGPGPETAAAQGPQWTADKGLTGPNGQPLTGENFRDLPPDQQARVRQLAEQQRANCAQFQGAPGCDVVSQILGLRNEREETPRNEQSPDDADPYDTGAMLAANGLVGVNQGDTGLVPAGKALAPQLTEAERNGATIAATYESTFRAQGATALQQLKGMARTAQLAATQPTLSAPDPDNVAPAGIIATQNCPTGQRCD